MSTVGNNRASVFAVVEETEEAVLKAPSAGSDFLPLRPGFGMEYKAEELTNDELQSDIGMAKSNKGKESVDGSHDAYIKGSGSEGIVPGIGKLYKNILGEEGVLAFNYTLTSGSTKSVLKLPTGAGENFFKGQAILIKDGVNGYNIRNIKDIVGDDLHLNFDLPSAPASGVQLGQTVVYMPSSVDSGTLSAWLYQGNGYAKTATAGCRVTEVSAEFPVNQFANAKFKYQGVKYYMNPVIITDDNNWLDFKDDTGFKACQIKNGVYKNVVEIAVALQDAMNAASTKNFEVTYSNETGSLKFKTLDSTLFELPFATGGHAANSIGPSIFFMGDLDSLTEYEAVQEYDNVIPPTYDVSDSIVMKDAEFYIGAKDMLIPRSASKATLKIVKKLEDADGITEETGTRSKVATSREVTLEAELILDKHDVSLYNYLVNNETISVMLNCGPKVAKNWVAGKCFNAYMPNAVVTGFSPAGDQFIIAKISVRGFIDNNYKDIFVSFI